jgi:hypothetical protein
VPGQAADYAERLDPPDVYVELITAEGVHDLRGQPRRGHPGSPEPAGEFGVHPWRQDIEYLDFVPQFGAQGASQGSDR